MTVDIRPFPRVGWDPLPGDGGVGVVGRLLVSDDAFFVAQLRFTENASINPHAGERDTIVVCIEGEGFTSVGDETVALHEGQQVRWPSGIVHGLWTESSTMSTLMIEHFD
jgi:quercetin dioxygenase-like cupin family protein